MANFAPPSHRRHSSQTCQSSSIHSTLSLSPLFLPPSSWMSHSNVKFAQPFFLPSSPPEPIPQGENFEFQPTRTGGGRRAIFATTAKKRGKEQKFLPFGKRRGRRSHDYIGNGKKRRRGLLCSVQFFLAFDTRYRFGNTFCTNAYLCVNYARQ